MAFGPGKYDHYCTLAREGARAEGAILIIVNGEKGSGFSCQAEPEILARLPAMLETIAAQIRTDIEQKH